MASPAYGAEEDNDANGANLAKGLRTQYYGGPAGYSPWNHSDLNSYSAGATPPTPPPTTFPPPPVFISYPYKSVVEPPIPYSAISNPSYPPPAYEYVPVENIGPAGPSNTTYGAGGPGGSTTLPTTLATAPPTVAPTPPPPTSTPKPTASLAPYCSPCDLQCHYALGRSFWATGCPELYFAFTVLILLVLVGIAARWIRRYNPIVRHTVQTYFSSDGGYDYGTDRVFRRTNVMQV